MIIKAIAKILCDGPDGEYIKKCSLPNYPVGCIGKRPKVDSIKIKVEEPTAVEFEQIHKWLVDIQNSEGYRIMEVK